MDHLLRAYELLISENQSFEFASVFYMRPLLPFDLIPQLNYPVLSDSMLGEFTDLANYLVTSGEFDLARSIMKWIDEIKSRP